MRLRAAGMTLTVVAAAFAVWTAGGVTAQQAPGTPSAEWRSYAGDLHNQHYSPLDQITAANFNALEVAWRFKTDSLGPRPEFKLEGTPLVVGGVLYTTAGTRRAVVALDAATGELRWVHSEYEGARAANSPRQLSGRGVAYWTDGRDERILYVTTGYRLVALDAKTGTRIASFGKDGIVDLKEGVVVGKGVQIDLAKGEIGLHATPAITRDGVVLIGSSFLEGGTPKTHNNTKGLVRGFDVRTGQTPVDLQHHSASRRVRQRHVAERIVGGQRQRRRLEPDGRRRRARARLSAGRDAELGLLRRPAARQQPVCRKHRRRSTTRPAGGSGTSSSCTIRSGTWTSRRRRCWSTSRSTAGP